MTSTKTIILPCQPSANVKVALHDHQGALEDFDRVHELHLGDVEILESQGNVKVALHDHQGALEDFNRAHELIARVVRILESRENVKVALHDHQGALEDSNRAYELTARVVWIFQSRGNVKVALHDHQGASEDFRSAVNLARELLARKVWSLQSQGNVKVALHDYQSALEDFDRAHELDPCNFTVLQLRVNVKMTLFDHQGALQDLDKVHELHSSDVETLRLRGHVKWMMGDLKGAFMDWAMAHGLPYDDIVCFGNRAFLKRRLENYDGVVGELNHKQEFDFLLSCKKLILQLVVLFIVFVIFVFQYLIGYVERGQWGTYSNGTWEFRETYVCIELRLGSYPFQKFRERPPSCGYHGIRTKEKKGKNGKYIRYEPYLKTKNEAFYFRECKTLVKAAFTYDIAKLCLDIKGGHFNILLHREKYDHLPKIPEGHTKKDISKIVFECVESTFQSIKDHPTDADNQRILKLFEDGGEGCATNVHKMTLNEIRAMLDFNGGDDHATSWSMDMSAIGEVQLCSPNDGDTLATDIDEHANVHQMTLNENRAMLDSNGGDDHATRWSMDRSAIGEVQLCSPNDGDISATDIDEHANVHQMTLNENRAMLDFNGGDDYATSWSMEMNAIGGVATRWSMEMSAIGGVLLRSPNDGDIPAMDFNGGDDHATRWSMDMSGIGGLLLCSPNDGNISATDIDEHVNVHQMTLNENRAMLDSNGGDDHATRWSMEMSAVGEVLLRSPNDGDIPATDIDEHANVHQMTLNENQAMLDSNGEFTGKHNVTYKPSFECDVDLLDYNNV
jgi:hypothetical protein